MKQPTHKNDGVNRTKTMRFYPFVFTGNAPRKGKRIPLNEIKYNEQRDDEKGRSGRPFASERADEARSGIPFFSDLSYTYFGARYMDHELMTMWLSVDPLADKYPSISPYAYCAWNPIKFVDPDGCMIDDYFSKEGKYLGTDNAKTDNVRIMDEGRWNELNENGVIEHTVGYENSESFSSAHSSMIPKSQLEVYQHYNPTKCKLYATSSISNPGNIGMVTTTRKGISKIGVFLEDNFKGIAVSDHANEITNMFVHEGQHVKDHKNKAFILDYEYENSALMTQFNHDSWQKCRPEFRHAVTNYGRKVSTLPPFILDFNDPAIIDPFKISK